MGGFKIFWKKEKEKGGRLRKQNVRKSDGGGGAKKKEKTKGNVLGEKTEQGGARGKHLREIEKSGGGAAQ